MKKIAKITFFIIIGGGIYYLAYKVAKTRKALNKEFPCLAIMGKIKRKNIYI